MTVFYNYCVYAIKTGKLTNGGDIMYQILIILSLYVVFAITDGIIAGIDRWRVKRNLLSDPIKRYEYYKSGYTSGKIKRLRRMPYNHYLSTQHWSLIRSAALKRDGSKCADCGSGSDEKPLEVHHVTYSRKGKENLEDLLTLCSECHEERHFVASAFE